MGIFDFKEFVFRSNKVLPTEYDDSLSYYEVLNKVANNLNVISRSMGSLADSLVSPYDDTKHYVPGDYVWNNGHLYKCTNANYGSWNINDWGGDVNGVVFADSVSEDMADYKSYVDNIIDNFSDMLTTAINNVANPYDPTHEYEVGDYVVYSAILYKCIADTTGTFDVDDWEQVVVIDEVFNYMTEMWAEFIADYQRTFGIVQTTGDSVTDAMSQKAVTDELNLRTDKIYDGFLGTEIIKTVLDGWVQGAFTSAGGGNTSATNRIRYQEYKTINNRIGFTCGSDYKYMIFIYTGISISTYLGVYQRNGVIKKEAFWQTGTTFINTDKAYKYRIVVAKNDDADFTPENFDSFYEIFSTDRNYEKIGVPADSEKVGQSFKTVNDALFNGVASIKTAIYEHAGYISGAEWVSSSTRFCLIIPIDNSTIEIETGTHANDIAMLKTFSMDSPPDYSDDENWNYFVTIPANTSKIITVPSDAKYLYIYIGTKEWYPTLKIDGYFYSESLQNNFNLIEKEIKEFNSSLIKFYTNNKSTTTINGITYSIDNGVITYSGTANANTFIAFEGSTSAIPSWVQNGKYYAKITKDRDDEVRYQLSTYQTGQDTQLMCSTRNSSYFTVNNIENKNGAISRIWIPTGETVDNTIKIDILSAIPNEDILPSDESTPIKIRIMQYNIGKFNNGQSFENYHYITPENLETIINNYKKLLGIIQPDIIGIEEFEDTLTIGDNETISMNDNLFNRIYPYKYDETDVISKISVKSKFPFVSTKRIGIPYSYVYDDVSYNTDVRIVYTKINIYNKTIGIACTAFHGGITPKDGANRKAAYQAVINYLENVDYAFIVCDANNSGTRSGDGTISKSVEEGNSIEQEVMIPNGYTSAMGSYFPWQMTFKSQTDSHENAVDNIYYKNNSNIQIVNFESIVAERYNLASDHVPVYADFLLF